MSRKIGICTAGNRKHVGCSFLWFLLVLGRCATFLCPSHPGHAVLSLRARDGRLVTGLGSTRQRLPDVCVVARSSSVLMQAILLFVFTSYCPCDALQRGGREQAKIGRSRRTWRGARGRAVSTLVVSSVEPRVVGVLGTSECWSTPHGTSAHS